MIVETGGATTRRRRALKTEPGSDRVQGAASNRDRVSRRHAQRAGRRGLNRGDKDPIGIGSVSCVIQVEGVRR